MNGYSQNSTSILRQVLTGVKALKTFHLSDLRKVFSLMGKTEKIALYILGMLGALSLFISGHNFYINHTKPAPTLGGEMTEGVVGQPQYINPLLAISDADQALTKLVFSGLYKYGPNGELLPDLAESLPQISEDQKSYTITLKNNVLWHNHKPVTADDVVFTVNALKNPDYKSPLRGFWLSTNVEKLSDFSVKFINKDISGPFVYNLTLPILPKDVWQSLDPATFLQSKNNLEAVGSGPYAISQINKLPSGKIDSITLKSFTVGQKTPANIETVSIKFYDSQPDLLNGLRSKEINAAGFVPAPGDQLSGFEHNYKLYKLPLPQYQTIFFNLNEGLTSQDFIRQALKLATDQQGLLNGIFQSSRQTPVSPLSKKATTLQYNLEKAKSILDQAGWTVGADNLRHKKDQTLGITLTTSDSPANSQVAMALQKQWQDLNIQVNIDVKPSKQLMEETIRPRKFQALLYSQKFGADPDPFFFWHSSQTKDPGLNLTGLSDPSLDKLLTDARNTTNSENRLQKYAAIDQYLDAKTASITLDQSNFFYFITPKVQNVGLKNLNDPASRFYGLPNWYIQTKRVWR